MQQHDEDLNRFLARRAAPKARPDLAERIIHAAITQVQDSPVIMGFWSELKTMLAIPHPSVAIATLILFGLVVGIQASDGVSALQQDWSSFLVINEGGWL